MYKIFGEENSITLSANERTEFMSAVVYFTSEKYILNISKSTHKVEIIGIRRKICSRPSFQWLGSE